MIKSTYEKLKCFLGLHNWYYGNYVKPAWGRFERHCMNCDVKQYQDKDKWVDFIYTLKLQEKPFSLDPEFTETMNEMKDKDKPSKERFISSDNKGTEELKKLLKYFEEMKKEWISVCSAHINKRDNCGLCQFGYYEYTWKLKLSKFIYSINNKIWIIFVNRKRK